MNKYEIFLNYIEELTDDIELSAIPKEVKEVLTEIESMAQEKEKPVLTPAGLEILEYLQKVDAKNFKAKDIADGIGQSSRKVSGALRKLVTDDFVNKFGQNPVNYILTEKGKNFDIKDYKERILNE